MRDLSRINLLVGGNNSGKTSLLEAIELLLAQGDPRSIWNSLNKRGERISDEEERRSAAEFDVCRLFHNYFLRVGSAFEITSKDDFDKDQSLRAKLVEVSDQALEDSQLSMFPQDVLLGGTALALDFSVNNRVRSEPTILPLTERGGLAWETIRRRPGRFEDQRTPVSFVSTSSLSSDEVIYLLGRYVLNPEEEFITEALRIIEKDIERIAPVSASSGNSSFSSTKGGVVIKLRNIKSRLPIGTMGDGIWRLLSLALSLAKSKGGVLLIDEIDTGLHYTVMESMWRLVFITAQRWGIQIFATTHSSDCWRSLASICRDPKFGVEASLQHIERNTASSKVFSGREMIIAAERGFEVR